MRHVYVFMQPTRQAQILGATAHGHWYAALTTKPCWWCLPCRVGAEITRRTQKGTRQETRLGLGAAVAAMSEAGGQLQCGGQTHKHCWQGQNMSMTFWRGQGSTQRKRSGSFYRAPPLTRLPLSFCLALPISDFLYINISFSITLFLSLSS